MYKNILDTHILDNRILMGLWSDGVDLVGVME